MLIILCNTVQRQLNTFSLLRGTTEELIIFRIIILLMRCNRVEIHVLWLNTFVLLSCLLQWATTISSNYDITNVVDVGLVGVSLPDKLWVLAQKGSFVKGFLSALTQNVSNHLLLIIGDLNMSDLA